MRALRKPRPQATVAETKEITVVGIGEVLGVLGSDKLKRARSRELIMPTAAWRGMLPLIEMKLPAAETQGIY